ncbi:MAG TPA: hypothetical protein VGI39_22410 [Polyangiaceae bacterium]
MNRKILVGIAILCALAGVAVAKRSSAGLTLGQNAVCMKNADSSGNCTGTFTGFRNSPGAGDFIGFEVTSSLTGTTVKPKLVFGASFGGVTYSCHASEAYLSTWTMALASRGNVSVSWDKEQNCTFVDLSNSSATP